MKKLMETISIDTLLSNGGIFKAIQSTQNQPFTWLTSDMALTLDKMYYLEHSGDKSISPFVTRLKGLEDEGKIFSYLSVLASSVIEMFNTKWNKVYKALVNSNYEPLENYNMEQVETPDITKNRTDKANTDVETRVIASSENNMHGFNSVNPVDTTGNDGDSTSHTTGDKEDNYTESEETETGTRALTRHGNIGVTTSQQMLESEMKLRENYNFVNILFRDVDKLMCLNIYC